mgnify:CR=1 FL=1
MRTSLTLTVLASAFLLSACAEKAQDRAGIRSDKPAQVGTGVAAFTDAGWTAGDKASWANHLRTRAQYGMNDHQRAPK